MFASSPSRSGSHTPYRTSAVVWLAWGWMGLVTSLAIEAIFSATVWAAVVLPIPSSPVHALLAGQVFSVLHRYRSFFLNFSFSAVKISLLDGPTFQLISDPSRLHVTRRSERRAFCIFHFYSFTNSNIFEY